MNSETSSDTELCVICGEPALGLGPFSRCQLCDHHLKIDLADAYKLQQSVADELDAYSQDVANDLAVESDELEKHLLEVQLTLASVQRDVQEYCTRLAEQYRKRLEAVHVCQRNLEDVCSYTEEVAAAEKADSIAEVVQLAESMQLSLPDLKSDFEVAKRLRSKADGAELQLRRLRQLKRLVGNALAGAELIDVATDTSSDSESAVVPLRKNYYPTTDSKRHEINKSTGSIIITHIVEPDGWVHWLDVCSDTSGFVANRSGRIVPAESADFGSEALSQQCVFAVLSDKEYLFVFSMHSSRCFRCYCPINWRKLVWGLHCDRQQLFIAQPDVVTVADLSGRIRFQIKTDVNNFGDVWGIGGNAAFVFVSSGNKIAAFDKLRFEFQFIITLREFPDADLYNMTCLHDCILVADKHHNMVHRVSIENRQLVTSFPIKGASGMAQFTYPYDVVVDSRGRLFVSEFRSHSVRVVDAESGSLLQTLGVPGESGSGDGKFCCPCGLAVLTGGTRDQLMVADRNNKRLLVFNIG